MTATSILTESLISRRNAMRMALAAAIAGKVAAPPPLFAAADDSNSTWNWNGNAGHTEEMPGPGLTLDGPLGEHWRITGEGFGHIVGCLNGVIYAFTSADDNYFSATSIVARSLLDGKPLWTLNAPEPSAVTETERTPPATIEPESQEIFFSESFAIDGDLVLAPLTNGHLWALDALTGDLRWDFDSESDYISRTTVVDHVAYFEVSDGVCALALGDRPEIRWTSVLGSYYTLLGVDAGLVFVSGENDEGRSEIRALTTDEGSEFWRFSLDELGDIDGFFGISEGNVFMRSEDDESQSERLSMIDRNGQMAWSLEDSGYNSNNKWVMSGTVTRLTPTQSRYDYCKFQGLFAGSGQTFWELDVNADRWPYTNSYPVLCAGIGYALVYDAYLEHDVLLAADPSGGQVFGVQDSHAIPLLVSDGVMLARDDDTDEILAIGTVPAVLQAGGRATNTKNTTLRGAPGDSAVEREELIEGTEVTVTGDSETSNDIEWLPVTISETESSGWVPSDVLEGLDGGMRFVPIDIGEFGQYTTYP